MATHEPSHTDRPGAPGAPEVIDLAPAGAMIGSGAPHSRAVLAALAVVAALAAAVLLLVPGGDAEVAVDEDAPTTTDDDERAAAPFPTPLALGAPDDGKESVGLPVKAEPATGLVDGQTVQVTGTGFPPGEAVGVVMCAKEAGRDHGARGVDACNIGRFAQANADADGVATVSFDVRRLVLLDGQEVDCASEAQRCLIGMGMLSDYDQSGGVLVDFDPSAPLPEPPTVTVEPSTGLSDGDLVTVRVTGLIAGTDVGASVCAEAVGGCVDPLWGDGPAMGVHRAAEDGTYVEQVQVWRHFGVGPWGPGGQINADCAVTTCTLAMWGSAPAGRAIPEVPLTFAGGPPARTPPQLTVESTGPYRAGDEIVAALDGAPENASIEAMLCAEPGACAWLPLDAAGDGDGVRMRIGLTVPLGEPDLGCLGRSCRLVVLVHGGASPAALHPEPVEVRIEG